MFSKFCIHQLQLQPHTTQHRQHETFYNGPSLEPARGRRQEVEKYVQIHDICFQRYRYRQYRYNGHLKWVCFNVRVTVTAHWALEGDCDSTKWQVLLLLLFCCRLWCAAARSRCFCPDIVDIQSLAPSCVTPLACQISLLHSIKHFPPNKRFFPQKLEPAGSLQSAVWVAAWNIGSRRFHNQRKDPFHDLLNSVFNVKAL